MKNPILSILICLLCILDTNAQLVLETKQENSFPLSEAIIYVDKGDHALVKKSAELLQLDIEMVTGKKPVLVNEIPAKKTGNIIVMGSIERCYSVTPRE